MGFRRGFWITMGTVLGAVAGVLGGLVVMPVIVELVPAGVPRIITMLAVTGLLIWFGMWLGRKIGARLRLYISHPVMRFLDKLLGAAGNAVVTAALIALVAFSISSIGVPGITSALKNSRIVSVTTDLDRKSTRLNSSHVAMSYA